ncbi:ATP-binding protein [Gemmatimonas sp.]
MATRTWVLTSDVHLIGPVVDVIVSMCRDAGFSGRHCRLNVPVAVTEAVTNAMLRGNSHLDGGQVTVSVVVDAERLLVDVTDEGQGFDLDCAERTPDDADWLEREDGRGVFLMRQLMDGVENRCLETGHLVRLILQRA